MGVAPAAAGDGVQMIYKRKGGEFLVNTSAAGDQGSPTITQLAGGGFVAFWYDNGGPGHGQVFDSAGQKVGAEIAGVGAVSGLSDGGFVRVVTTGPQHDIVQAQRFDSTGTPVGSAVTLAGPAPAGNTFAVWSNEFGSVSALPGGGYAVTWTHWEQTSANSSPLREAHVRTFDSSGAPTASDRILFSGSNPNISAGEVKVLASGNYVATWSDGSPHGQVFTAAGTAAGLPFTWYGSDLVGPSHLAALSTGGFVIVWENLSFFNAAITGIWARVYDSQGVPTGPAFVVENGVPDQYDSLGLAALPGGGFAVAWADSRNANTDGDGTSIIVQAFDSAAHRSGPELLVDTNGAGWQIQPSLTALPSGDLAVAWRTPDTTADGSGTAIKGQLFTAADLVSGGAAGETLNGGAANDDLNGGGGDDILSGGAGNDALDGGPGSDTLSGGDGADVLTVSGLGSDHAAGGAGLDRLVIDFSDSPTGISTLAAPAANATDGGYDGSYGDGSGRQVDFTSIERLEITGSAAADSITGTGGEDLIIGGGGNDVLNGGDGADVIAVSGNGHASVNGGPTGYLDRLSVNWSDSVAAIVMGPLASDGNGSFNGAIGDGGARQVDFTTIHNFSIVTGSGDDRVTLGDGLNTVSLGAGNDVLVLTGYTDTADGGAGEDGISADFSGAIVNVVWNLKTNTFTGPASSLVNFEYFGTLRTGSGFDNIVTGTAARDDTVYTGGSSDFVEVSNGHDFVDGGAGFDTLRVDYSAATASVTMSAPILASGGGSGLQGQISDGAGRSVSFDNIESLQVTTGSGADTVVGGGNNDIFHTGAGADILTGNGGGDTLDGGAGADQMAGGLGNDIYLVDDAGDVVTENAGEGTADEVRTALSGYALPANVEKLTWTGAGAGDLRGNGLDNVLTGGAAGDLVRAQDGGNDIVNLGAGNDAAYFGSAYTSADSVDGGTGSDQVGLQGDYSGGVTLGTLAGVETLVPISGTDTRFGDPGTSLYSYNIVSPDATVAAGAQLLVNASMLEAGENLTFDGHLESDGTFFIYGGKGVDTLTGGAGPD
ncbi:MAG: hypothetical protein QOG84_434, partial [Sphingomonadales bacterium]|nr:hypothetical protein [Sphingomonadales bacterium]